MIASQGSLSGVRPQMHHSHLLCQIHLHTDSCIKQLTITQQDWLAMRLAWGHVQLRLSFSFVCCNAGLVPWLTGQAQSEMQASRDPASLEDGSTSGPCSPLAILAGLLEPCLGYAARELPQATVTILQAFESSSKALGTALAGTPRFALDLH